MLMRHTVTVTQSLPVHPTTAQRLPHAESNPRAKWIKNKGVTNTRDMYWYFFLSLSLSPSASLSLLSYSWIYSFALPHKIHETSYIYEATRHSTLAIFHLHQAPQASFFPALLLFPLEAAAPPNQLSLSLSLSPLPSRWLPTLDEFFSPGHLNFVPLHRLAITPAWLRDKNSKPLSPNVYIVSLINWLMTHSMFPHESTSVQR